MSGFEFTTRSLRAIDATRVVGEVTVTLRAENIRKERTGIHAVVAFAVGSTVVHDDNFNLSRDSERHNYANRLYGTRLKPGKIKAEIAKLYDQETFEHEFMLWSRAVWIEWVGTDIGEEVSGDLTESAPTFAIGDYIVEGGGTVLFGPPKKGKSFTAMLWAVSVDSGTSLYWDIPRPRKAMYINLERGAQGMTRRLAMVNRILGLDPDRKLLMMNRRGKSLADIYEAAVKTVEKYGVEVVFLDSLTRGGFGNLNGNEEANKAMDFLNGLCPTWCAIGHTPYEDDSKLFGSQMFKAAYDVGVNVRNQYKKAPDGSEDKLCIGTAMVVADTNDIMPAPMRIWAYEFQPDRGLVNVRDAHRNEFPELEATATSPRTNQERVYDHYLAHGPVSQSQVAKDLGINKGRVAEATNALLKKGEVLRDGQAGRELLFNARLNVMEGSVRGERSGGTSEVDAGWQ